MKRMTRQRKAIMDCFKQSNHPLSVEEILEKSAKAIPQLNLATVYRNLKILIDEKAIVSVDVPGSSTRYELVNLGHHHHFLCHECNRLYDIPGCPGGIGSLVPEGFKMIEHTLFLTGFCSACT